MVDVIFADVAQPDQARIVGLNAHMFLKNGGGVLISIKASCIDSTAKPEVVFAHEIERMRAEKIKPKERKYSINDHLKFYMLTCDFGTELTLGKNLRMRIHCFLTDLNICRAFRT